MPERASDSLFNQYVENLETVRQNPYFAVQPEIADSFVCPLCLGVFDREHIRELSIEHVPPKALGGRPVTLTCATCNNQAGTMLDSELIKMMDIHAFGTGFPGSQLDAEYRVDDMPENRTLKAVFRHSHTGVWQLIGDPKRSDPSLLNQAMQSFEKFRAGIQTARWHVQFKAWRPRRPEVALLRTAYLRAFSVFGYSFLRDPNMDVLRRQINSPDEEVIQSIGIPILPTPPPVKPFDICFVDEPSLPAHLLVVIRLQNHDGFILHFGVPLPLPFQSAEIFYDAFYRRVVTQTPLDVTLSTLASDFSSVDRPFMLYEYVTARRGH